MNRDPDQRLRPEPDANAFHLSGWSLWCLIAGTLGQVAFYTDLLKPFAPAGLVIAVFLLPICLVLFIRPGEVSDRLVRRCHLFAAGWYVLLTVVAEVLVFAGYVTEGSGFFRVLMHLGWLQFAPVIRSYLLGSHRRGS